MKLIGKEVNLDGIDCHIHSRFSVDALRAGAASPDEIANTVRSHGLRGFIVTDHLDIGHWPSIDTSRFNEYFDVWNEVRDKNPDLTIYIGMEVGFEKETAEQAAELIQSLPLEYVINSVHYWKWLDENDNGRVSVFAGYLQCVLASLDAPYSFTTIGHLGFPERYVKYPIGEREMEYKLFKPLMDEIIEKTVERGIRFEENTNAGGVMRLPRADFLRAYKKAGGMRPVIGSDAHKSDEIGQHFGVATKFLDKIFQ
ncbi:MAG: PHP domain-containing protein [Clostridiales bacterium]|nr:PHP domain-containing protein [Clostridiales bacterium]